MRYLGGNLVPPPPLCRAPARRAVPERSKPEYAFVSSVATRHEHSILWLEAAVVNSIQVYLMVLLTVYAPTFWTQRGVAKSLPPWSLKPQGVPSVRVSLTVEIAMTTVCRFDCRTRRQIKLRPRSLAPHKTTRHCQDPPACPTRQIWSEQTTGTFAMLNSRHNILKREPKKYPPKHLYINIIWLSV